MIYKTIKVFLLSSLFLGTTLLALDLKETNYTLKKEGLKITYIDENDDTKTIMIKRRPDQICSKVNGGDPDVIWGGDYANKSVPTPCKKTFVTTMGMISPIKIAKGIETYGEMEVLDFIKKSQKDKNLILVDARMHGWYKKGTIPTSINLPFKSFNPKHQDFEIVMDRAGVEYEGDKYDFSNAKTLLIYCNGTWCPQSGWAIKNLLKIGYPKEKLLWYRGGMYGWKSINLTTTIPQ